MFPNPHPGSSSGGGGTQLSFWYRCAAKKSEQRGLWMDHCRIWNPEFLAQFEALELNSLLILRLWGLFFLKLCDLRMKVVCWELKNAEMGSCERPGEYEKGSSGLHIPGAHFLVSTPHVPIHKRERKHYPYMAQREHSTVFSNPNTAQEREKKSISAFLSSHYQLGKTKQNCNKTSSFSWCKSTHYW